MKSIIDFPQDHGLSLKYFASGVALGSEEDGNVFAVGIWMDLKTSRYLMGYTTHCQCGNFGVVFDGYGKEDLQSLDKYSLQHIVSKSINPEDVGYWAEFMSNLPEDGNKIVCKVIE